MKRQELGGKSLQGFGTDQLEHLHSYRGFGLELFDKRIHAVHPHVGRIVAHDGTGGLHQHDIYELGRNGESQFLRSQLAILDELFQDQDMAIILIHRRGNTFPMIEIDPFPSAVGVPDLGAEAFALDDVDLKVSIDDEVVDLGHASPPFQSQIMNDGPIGGRFEMEIDMIRGFVLAPGPGFDEGDVLCGSIPKQAGRGVQGFLQLLQSPVERVPFLKDHKF